MRSAIFIANSLLAACTSAYVLPSTEPTSLVSKRQNSNPVVAAAAFRALVERFNGDQNMAATDPTASAQCKVDGAKMPQAPKPLSSPAEGLVLSHVVIGRGTQNYTCADSTKASVPAAVGAVATLFNVTCMASPFPQLLSSMPQIALRFPIPTSDKVAATDAFLSGHHFFSDNTTPDFDLNTDKHKWGKVQVKKDSATPAPNAAKDVPWLKLVTKNSEGCTIAEVYRVDTAGGVAPATCEGQAASFQIQYAANYWMWSNPAGIPGTYPST